MATQERTFDYPVYETHGGLARSIGVGRYIFVTKPDYPGLDAGDDVPGGWDLVPANDLAQATDEAMYTN